LPSYRLILTLFACQLLRIAQKTYLLRLSKNQFLNLEYAIYQSLHAQKTELSLLQKENQQDLKLYPNFPQPAYCVYYILGNIYEAVLLIQPLNYFVNIPDSKKVFLLKPLNPLELTFQNDPQNLKFR